MFAGYLALSVIMWWRVWGTGHPSSTMTCPCGDPALIMWWFEWLPWAVTHGHNPLLTNALYAGRGGVNALANTSSLFPALIVSPVTLLFGPVAAFNVTLTLAPPISAWCMFLLARKLTQFVPAQIIAGLLWGFSPFVFDNLGTGHVFLVLGFFPPLAALIAYDVLVEHRRRPATNGAFAGILIAMQFFTGAELLALTVVVGAVGLIIAAALMPGLVRSQWYSIGTAGGAALATSVVLLAYPAWFQIAGPRHISGQVWPKADASSAPLSGVVNAGPFVHQISGQLAIAGYFGGQGPDGLYLGWAVLAFLAVSAVLWRHRRLAWCALGAGLWAWVLTQGVDVRGWWPWHLLARVPLIAAAFPPRFADLIDFCVALLLIISMDEWWKWIRAKTNAGRDAGAGLRGPRGAPTALRDRRTAALQGAAAVALVGIVVTSLVPIATTYTLPLTVLPARLPAWFTHQGSHLPRGTRLVVIPYSPSALASQTTAYQTEDSLRFDLAGGYSLVPAADGTSAMLQPLEGAPRILQDLSASQHWGGHEPARSPQLLDLVPHQATFARFTSSRRVLS